jgi:hypothetical protein
LHDRIRKEFKIKLKYSKELMEMRKQVQTYISLKMYDEASDTKDLADLKEMEERQEMEREIEEIILK